MPEQLLKFNDTRIKCKGYTPVHSVERVVGVSIAIEPNHRAFDYVYRGKRVVEPGTSETAMLTIYFTTAHDTSDNDLDRMTLPVMKFDDRLLGVPFWLVPDNKILFGVDEGSELIRRAPLQLRKPNPIDQLGI